MMFEIPGRLPGTNEIIDAAKKGKGKYQPYSIMKSEWTHTIAWLAKKLPAYNRVDITITWYEPNEKRDPDNIMGGQKFILDGLVMAGVIPNDTRKHIRSIKHIPELDRENPRVEVQIEEAEGSEC
jgi:Holliday junction resolvase RusA-like endonuclease